MKTEYIISRTSYEHGKMFTGTYGSAKVTKSQNTYYIAFFNAGELKAKFGISQERVKEAKETAINYVTFGYTF